MKWVSPNGPADLGGMLPGDHVLAVDGHNVTEETHQKVRGFSVSCTGTVSCFDTDSIYQLLIQCSQVWSKCSNTCTNSTCKYEYGQITL